MNQVRIIGGALRRRILRFPSVEGLRPTPDRVRETLFNWLGQTLDGFHCLDLFAGSGALGFEAASRGAASVILLETDRAAASAIRENIKTLAVQNLQLLELDALKYVAAPQKKKEQAFDLIFLDPPFQQDFLAKLAPYLAGLLTQGGRVYVESALEFGQLPFTPEQGWTLLKQGRAGQVHFYLVGTLSECGT